MNGTGADDVAGCPDDAAGSADAAGAADAAGRADAVASALDIGGADDVAIGMATRGLGAASGGDGMGAGAGVGTAGWLGTAAVWSGNTTGVRLSLGVLSAASLCVSNTKVPAPSRSKSDATPRWRRSARIPS